MSRSIAIILTLATWPTFSMAGDFPYGKQALEKEVVEADPWADTRRPISNPTLFDLAIPRSQLHPVFIYNTLPNFVDTTAGLLPMGGDFQLYALQLEYALSDRLSINAVKDGYIDYNPDATFAEEGGWANIGAGLKYAWLLKEEERLASNFQLQFEFPSGTSNVWQGEDDGIITPSMSFLKLCDKFQFADQFGFRIPISDADASVFYNSFHVSYAVTEWLFPMLEVNVFHVTNPGDGSVRFPEQAGGVVPAIARFEGGDLINLGAVNTVDNFVSMAIGARARLNDSVDVGFGWEFPLTDEQNGLMEDRFTLDFVIRY